MARTKLGSAARYGARYGKRLKAKILTVEQLQKRPQKCPYCNHLSAKRVALGIFVCKKCDVKFTGLAYRAGD